MASTYLDLRVHIVFATRGRQNVIGPDWRNDLHAFTGGIIRGLGAYPLAIGGVEDHVHLLIGIRATHCVADLVREIKKASSAWMAPRVPAFHWQEGYAAFSVSHGDLSRVFDYIARQEEHHRKLSSLDELRSLLAEAGIDHDERFFE